MKRKPITLALSLLLVASIAFAGNFEKGHKMDKNGPKNEKRECLLTEDERDQVQDAKRDFEKVIIPMRADVKVLMMEIEDMVVDGKSSKEIAPKLAKLNAVKAQMAAERLDRQIKVRKIVGEEKYEKMGMAKKHMAKGMKNKAGKSGKGQQGKHGFRNGGEHGQACDGKGRFNN